MRPFRDLADPRDALDRLLKAVKPVAEPESVPLDRAVGRVLAEDVRAPRDVPEFARSAVDGFAVRSRDTRSAPVAFPVTARRLAGRVRKEPTVEAATLVEIATGAPVPEGADAVVPVELTAPARDADFVVVLEPVEKGANVRGRGHDVRRGARVLRAGDVVTPPRVAVASAIGQSRLKVWRRPVVHVFPTGDELVPPGQKLAAGQIHESNGVAVVASLSAWGADARASPPVKDTAAALARALERAKDADVVVFTGGSSVGERDLIADAIKAAGGRILAHGIRLKPGKPLLLARLKDGRVVVGLPGNPTSALTDAHLFLAPTVRFMARLPPMVPHRVHVTLAEDVTAPEERALILPVHVHDGVAHPTFKDSGAITSLTESNAWLALDAGDSRKAGDSVDVNLWW